MALGFLVAQASSAADERLFSKAQLVLNEDPSTRLMIWQSRRSHAVSQELV